MSTSSNKKNIQNIDKKDNATVKGIEAAVIQHIFYFIG